MLIVFTPLAGGTRTGAVTLTDNGPGGTQTAALSGAGIDFALLTTGPTSATVASGASATYALLLTSAAGVSGTAALTCTGAPAHSLCTVTPASATLTGSVPITVTVQTGLAQVRLTPPLLFGARGDLILLALLLPLGMSLRKRRPRAALMLFAVGVLSLSGCGAGRQIPAGGIVGPPTPTPAGTYTLTVSAISAGITHSVGLTLIVQ
jgi:hypothetical protein